MVLIKKELQMDSEMNFVSEVSSVFHLLCALSYANMLSKETNIKGTIFIRTHFIENEPIDEQRIEFDNLNINLIRYKNKYKYINFTNKEERTKVTDKKNDIFYLLSIKVPNLDLYLKYKKSTDKKICVVLIDEGTGTYYNFSGALYPFKTFFKKMVIYLNSSKVKPYFFLKRKGNKVIPNKETVYDLVKVIDIYNKYYPVKNINYLISSGEKYAMLISGLFIEMGLISLENYIRKLHRLKNIFEKKGLKLLIKPYQSENLHKYENMDFEILPWDASCEVLFPLIKPKFTVGFLSTSMITGKVLYGIDSIDISNIFGLNENIEQRKKYNKIFKLFNDYMYRTNSFESLENIIERIS